MKPPAHLTHVDALKSVIPLLLASGLSCLPAVAAFENWTNKEGRTVSMEFVRLMEKDGARVAEFKTVKGKLTTVKLSSLAEADANRLIGGKPPTQSPEAVKPEKKRLFDEIKEAQRNFGKQSTTKVKIVSGPQEVKMMRDQVPGRQWHATCGEYKFKITLQDGVNRDSLEKLVKRIEQLPMPYIRALQEVSDPSEDGAAIYLTLGDGAGAHGGKRYLNMVQGFFALGIAHEAGHILEQVYRETDSPAVDGWAGAIAGDNISVSRYGDNSTHEDLAEFAQAYAACLDGGKAELAKLEKLSPRRFKLWEHILYATPAR